ncbi:MAG: MFS transporter [Minisyncoccota bacterium]
MIEHELTEQEKKRGFLGLYFGRVITTISTALLGIFLPIFLYGLFEHNIHAVLVYYFIAGFVYMLLVAKGAQFLNKFGFRRALVVGTIAAAAINVCYYFLTKENVLFIMPLIIFLLVIFRMLFWIPYHVDFALFTKKGGRGGQVGFLLATLTLLGVAGPMIAGYIITNYGVSVLFSISVIVFLLGVIPFSFIPRTNEKFSWDYARSWREVFERKNRAVVLGNIALGAEETVGAVIWPIFIFLLLDSDYFKVGALSSFIAGATALMQLFLGHYLDRIGNKKHVLRIGSILYALGWIVKIFVVTAFQVFIAGLYHKFAKIFTDTSFDAIFYELAADQGHYIDEFTVLGEVAVQIGRIASIVIVGVMTLYMSIEWTFVIGALAALSFNALYGKLEQRV